MTLYITSIISTNVRHDLNDSFGSRTELVQNAYEFYVTHHAGYHQCHSPAQKTTCM